ncbi:ABC transporter permease [Bacteroidota bacterium]
MIRNFLTVTLRNLLKNRIYSIINITGLSIGITCSILILLWVSDELSYDKFHPKADRLYQVWVQSEYNDQINSWTSLPLPVYQGLKDRHANIVNTVVTDWGGSHLLMVGEKRLTLTGHNVGEEFLTMFEFPLIAGSAADVLNNPSSIVITEETAKSFFGDEDPINKVIRVDDKGDLKVSGVLENIPENSSFQFDFLLPYKYWRSIDPWVVDNEDNWGNYSFQMFVELSDPMKKKEVNEGITSLLVEHDQVEMKPALFLYPMDRWHLHSSFENGVEKGGMIEFVQMFTLIAIFILFIACINFMNLATARSEGRAREVGIRKSVGSNRIDLILQFISESILITLIAFITAILLAQLVLPLYNQLVEKALSIPYSSPIFWLISVITIVVTGVLAGSYPAFYLSSFKPVKVLKGKITEGKNASLPRKILVILQFAVSILLIMATIVIHQQIQLTKNRELGYKQDNLIYIRRNEELDKNYRVMKNELLQSGLIKGMTVSNSPITQVNSNNFLGWPGKPDDQRILFVTITTEYDYAHTMGINVLMGRDFSKDFKSDSSAILINKAALDLMDLEDPIGTELELWGEKRRLVGVLDNVLMESPHSEIRPLFVILEDWRGVITVRIKETKNLKASLDDIGKIFQKYNPAYPFEYQFADVEFEKKFKTINLTSSLSNLFATLAIVITGLGLFGLAAYTAEQRTKEIGIRKVMGASAVSIVRLMTSDFSRLVIIAYVISAPVSWWLLKMYLDRYPIHTKIHYWIFITTGVFALLFSLLIVTSQSLRAANTNPVNSLRDE